MGDPSCIDFVNCDIMKVLMNVVIQMYFFVE